MKMSNWLLAPYLIVLLAFSVSQAIADDLPRLVVKCTGLFNLCGYYDRHTEEQVIAPQFERAMLFKDGLAPVRLKGRFGYIDTKGEMVIKPQYDLAGSFYQGLAEVLVNGKAGVINRKGEMIVEPQFARAVPFTKEVVLVQDGEWKSGYFEGYEKLEGLADGTFFSSKQSGLYHIKEGWITKPRYLVSPFEQEGRGLIWAKEDRSAQDGLLRADGTWQIPPTYDHTQRLMDGLAVINQKQSAANGKTVALWGAVNQEGKLAIAPTFEHLSYWANGYGLARKDGKTGLVDKQGKLLGGRYFDQVNRSEDDQPSTVLEDGKWWAINRGGQLAELKSDESEADEKRAIAITKNINKVRQKTASAADNGQEQLLKCPGGATLFNKGEHWGMKDPDGAVIIEPSYRALYCFFQGVAWIPVDEKKQWCPVGTDGKRQDHPACRETYYPYIQTHSYPEPFDEDIYESSVLWVRAFLDYGQGKRKEPPKMIPDGYMGTSSIRRN